ncbi:SAM-dependent methyltransferase [Sphingomonas sp. BN140010]|uniref:site-specific DNA-methyltransferase (adenine-specific) n=1 Tax=Sphingomonas arvum TaxID=2992113 RepID=A0ABT3JE73_9SPHN|nr:SAM-dependent methyltransferase [Sphingomonas sp. BN140010]MCW3797376.1 SAM-dependent methyltransferase [Sphingomonas sp. BN140010]
MAKFKTNKLDPTLQKLRGGYYTPLPLADFLASWAIRTGAESVLEPSCGDGNFIEVAAKHLTVHGSITGVELLEQELERAKNRGSTEAKTRWIQGDFFERFDEVRAAGPYDAILGNPPFIRFQHFDAEVRDRAFGYLKSFGYHPTKLANAWCAFVQLCAELVAPGGRMALVLPAELLQVGYARELREKLPHMFRDILLVAFDELVFPDIQQEVVLLLAEDRTERAARNGTFHTVQVRNGADLLRSNLLQDKVGHLPARHTRSGMKWTSLFLDPATFDILDEVQRQPNVRPLSDFAEVDVGVVTGRNSFFVVTKEQADQIGVNGFALPTVGRTSALKSIYFNEADLDNYQIKNPSRLINLRGVHPDRFSPELRTYLDAGEAEGVHKGYKCSVRPRWYDVPSIYVPDAFMFRQIHNAPFLVANCANATATDTIHRVRIRSGIDRDRLCASSINSLSFAWAEVCGRSYGGGVLELEPREAEELPSLYDFSHKLDVAYIDASLRSGDLKKALQHSDQVLLRDGLGLSGTDVARISAGWDTLRNRRQGRRRTAD